MSSYPPIPPAPPGYPRGPMRTTNGKAIAAMICGICGFASCGLSGIAAVILAPMAKREIDAQPDVYDGRGMALAGQITGWISIGMAVAIFLVYALVFFAAFSTSFNDFGTYD